jgi:hypothetical protein
LLYRVAMRNTLAALALTLTAAIVPAEAGSLAMVASTARLDYFAEKGEKVDVQKTERFLESLEKQFGHTPRARSRFVRYRNAEGVVQATGFYAAGVTLPRQHEVHSTLAYHPHELVHLVASSVGDPGVVFQEGLAVVLGDEGKVDGRHVKAVTGEEADTHTYQQVADRFRLGGAGLEHYRLAAAFMLYLDERGGRETLLGFFADCPKSSAAPAAFQRAYGSSIEEAWKQFQESRPRRKRQAPATGTRMASND